MLKEDLLLLWLHGEISWSGEKGYLVSTELVGHTATWVTDLLPDPPTCSGFLVPLPFPQPSGQLHPGAPQSSWSVGGHIALSSTEEGVVFSEFLVRLQ